MDRRLQQINSRLTQYSQGNFKQQLKLSPALDEIDAISAGINMVVEELKASTISKNYFTNIFNSVSDMVFVTNSKGIIKDINNAAEKQLNYAPGSLTGKNIHSVLKTNPFNGNPVSKKFEDTTLPETYKNLICNDGIIIPVSIKVSCFKDIQKKDLQLITASDVSSKIRTENQILRAIIDTQEKERQRFAKDLHDSLIQKLSAIKFYINTSSHTAKEKKVKTVLLQSNSALDSAIKEVRNLCFNLMPKILEEFGLIQAIREYTSHLFNGKKTRFLIHQNKKFPKLAPEIKIDLYRILQELIANAMNHGKATKIEILFRQQKNLFSIILSDNGKGFDVRYPSNGMGLQNVHSRIKSHNGSLTIDSKTGLGTTFNISMPINN